MIEQLTAQQIKLSCFHLSYGCDPLLETDRLVHDSARVLKSFAQAVATTPAALKLANSYNIQVPIVHAVYDVLQGVKTPVDAIMGLMVPSGAVAQQEDTI